MIRSSKTDIMCIAAAAMAVIITALLTVGCLIMAEPEEKPRRAVITSVDYENRLFDDSYVHEIDIRLPRVNWDYMVEHATEEQYVICTAVIDGEEFKNVAIRPKGNSSLGAIKSQGSDRFSFKIEFDHYSADTLYYGLDKLALNNLGQDVSCMKDYLCYHMMNEAGVASPLSSYVMMKLNGEDFGLYLAVEGIEDSFAFRNYGEDFGNIYKPECFAVENVTPQAFMNKDMEIFSMDINALGPGDRLDVMGAAVRVPFENCFGDNMAAAAFKYVGDETERYNVFFEGTVFDITEADKLSLVDAIRRLNSGGDPEEAMDTESLINYFMVHNFVNNYDSYSGIFVHNYYVYEKDGKLSMIPWDYNLAFGIFTFETVVKSILGDDSAYEVRLEGNAMDDVTNMVNYPIDTPTISVEPEERPLMWALLGNEKYLEIYHERYREFLNDYFYSGRFEKSFRHTREIIAPYIERGLTFYAKDKSDRGAEAVYEYCMLRAQSIQGQLDGVIPATMEGQREDYANLIDASGIDLASSVTFDSLIFGIRNEDVIQILDAIAGDYPHNTEGFEKAVAELAENSGRIPSVILRALLSCDILKRGIISALAGPLLLIASLILLCAVRKWVMKYERRKA